MQEIVLQHNVTKYIAKIHLLTSYLSFIIRANYGVCQACLLAVTYFSMLSTMMKQAVYLKAEGLIGILSEFKALFLACFDPACII